MKKIRIKVLMIAFIIVGSIGTTYGGSAPGSCIRCFRLAEICHDGCDNNYTLGSADHNWCIAQCEEIDLECFLTCSF